ncbi:hypothetical protein ACA910_002456 [Epithemia clementina (nom. ined.)]
MNNSSFTRCSVSSLSLSALSISSDDGSAHYSAQQHTPYQPTFLGPQGAMKNGSSSSLTRKSWGSNACQNLASLATQQHMLYQEQSQCHHQEQHQHQVHGQSQLRDLFMNGNGSISDDMMMDTDMMASDEWGYFLDTSSPLQQQSHQVALPQW